MKRGSVTNFMLRLLCLIVTIKIRSKENGPRFLEGSEGVTERGKNEGRSVGWRSKERVSGVLQNFGDFPPLDINEGSDSRSYNTERSQCF